VLLLCSALTKVFRGGAMAVAPSAVEDVSAGELTILI